MGIVGEDEGHDWLCELAAAVADGRVLDWDGLESSARTGEERSAISRLRAIAAIGQVHTELTFSDSSGESVSVRSLLQGFEDSSTPASWGSLRILERVGRGRFGDVYRAWDPSLDREVALKLLRHRDTDSDREVIEEGRLMARVRHPNVVTIHGAQRIDGRTGLWMEFVEGRTLEADLKARGPFSPGEVIEVGIQLCRALAAVHGAGLVHRDVKAQNVLRDSRGRVVLGDFGTGSNIADARCGTVNLAGTPAYLAPEVFQGGTASVQSDIYSLGVLLFHLCSGTYPVVGASLREIRAAHKEKRRTTLATVRSGLPMPLTSAIERAIAVDPETRHQSAFALEEALAAASASQPPEKSSSRHLTAVGALSLALVLLAWWGVASRAPSASTERTTVSVSSGRGSASTGTVNTLPSTSPPDSGQVASAPLEGNAPIATVDESRMTAGTPTPVSSEMIAPRTFRRIGEIDAYSAFVTPSPDGRLLSLMTNGELGVLEIDSGRKWSLTASRSEDSPECFPQPCRNGVVYDSRFSRDGSRITYLRGSQAAAGPGSPRIPPEIRRIATKGGQSTLIWRASDVPSATPGMRLFHWAGDDSLVLAGRWLPMARELMVISTATGQVVANHITPTTIIGASLSPDGRFVAYDFVEPSSGLRDIEMWTVGTDDVTPLVRDIASDRSPMWTSDGKHLLFISSRSGTNALWAHRFENGRIVGPPILVRPDVGDDVFLLGASNSGTVFVGRNVGGRDVYMADMDPKTLDVTSTLRRVSTRSAGNITSASWSTDGRFLAYSRQEDDRFTIVVKSMNDGGEQEFRQPFVSPSSFQWEPDGSSLLLRTGVGLQRFTVDTRAITTVLEKSFLVYEALPKPGMVLISQQEPAGATITLNNLKTGEETVVHRLPGRAIGSLIASHRGDAAAYLGVSRDGLVIRIVDLNAPYQSREAFSSRSPDEVSSLMTWSADDRELIVGRRVDSKGKPLPSAFDRTLWVLNLTTGNMRFLSDPPGAMFAHISPDGRHLAIESQGVPSSEVWALENALTVLSR